MANNFCIAPFIQITTHPDQKFGPCSCLSAVMHHTDLSIKDQWESTTLTKLRQQFANNERPEICKRCWKEEDAGVKSLRKRIWDPEELTTDFPTIVNLELVNTIRTTLQPMPQILTLSNGNVCNAKCRTCSPYSSSRWNEDAERFQQAGKSTYIPIKVADWTEKQINDIVDFASTVKRLELYGGEPTYNKKVKVILERLISAGVAKNITLYINTNGSVDIINTIPQLTKFKNIEINISVDGVDHQFNYIRHGVDFDAVVKHINTWKDIKNVHVDTICTVNMLNVYYLPDVRKRIVELLPLEPFWNILDQPAYLNIKNMPQYVKDIVCKKLQNAAGFDDIITYINQPADLLAWHKFIETTQDIDQIRKESFAQTFPEFYRIIHG